MSSKITIKSSPGVGVVGLVSIIAGVLLIVAGGAAWGLVSQQLANENITVSEDAPFLAGKNVNDPLSAFAQADAISQHARDMAGGKTYSQLSNDDPVRATVMNASFLRASLFTSVVSFGVALLVMAAGVLFILQGWALRRLAGGPPVVVETDTDGPVIVGNSGARNNVTEQPETPGTASEAGRGESTTTAPQAGVTASVAAAPVATAPVAAAPIPAWNPPAEPARPAEPTRSSTRAAGAVTGTQPVVPGAPATGAQSVVPPVTGAFPVIPSAPATGAQPAVPSAPATGTHPVVPQPHPATGSQSVVSPASNTGTIPIQQRPLAPRPDAGAGSNGIDEATATTAAAQRARSVGDAEPAAKPDQPSFDDVLANRNSNNPLRVSRSERLLGETRARAEADSQRTGMTGTIPIVGGGSPAASPAPAVSAGSPAGSPAGAHSADEAPSQEPAAPATRPSLPEEQNPTTGATGWQSPQDRLR